MSRRPVYLPQPTQKWLAGLILALAATLLVIHVQSTGLAPSADTQTSPYAPLLERLAGPGEVQVGDSGSGQIVILLNRSVAESQPGLASDLSAIVQAMAPNRDIMIRAADFAAPATDAMSVLEWVMTVGLFLMAALSAGLLASLLQITRSVLDEEPVPANDTAPPPAIPVTPPAGPVGQASDLAQRNPTRTAAILKRWLAEDDQPK